MPDEPVNEVRHVPVLVDQVVELLAVQPGDTVLDCTVGLAGHAGRLARSAGERGMLIGMDVDPAALSAAAERLEGLSTPWRLFQANFTQIAETLDEVGIGQVDVVLADLGASSLQFDDPERGFSFQADGPLDMRMDDRLEDTAADLVNRLDQSALADILYFNAQERKSRRIARAIHRARRAERITTTARLAAIVCAALRTDPASRKSRIHPATRTFQALRIAVNQELAALKQLLDILPAYLAPGGRVGVISFHSLEDAVVKRDFLARRGEGIYDIVTKKPMTPDEKELRSNPRSRSAKFRVARRTRQPVA